MNFAKNFKNTVSPVTAFVTEYSSHMKKNSLYLFHVCAVLILVIQS